ncbi:hypothetical protein [Prochlorothrix hollandica]|uniref:hypothetical protein n=1 Tax=Prochlorothrix hollandica TaxID=1223 RepID=UPI003340CC4E
MRDEEHVAQRGCSLLLNLSGLPFLDLPVLGLPRSGIVRLKPNYCILTAIAAVNPAQEPWLEP